MLGICLALHGIHGVGFGKLGPPNSKKLEFLIDSVSRLQSQEPMLARMLRRPQLFWAPAQLDPSGPAPRSRSFQVLRAIQGINAEAGAWWVAIKFKGGVSYLWELAFDSLIGQRSLEASDRPSLQSGKKLRRWRRSCLFGPWTVFFDFPLF
jgi:hypothetical protein